MNILTLLSKYWLVLVIIAAFLVLPMGSIFQSRKSNINFGQGNPQEFYIEGDIMPTDMQLQSLMLHVQSVQPNYPGQWICTTCPYGAVNQCDSYCRGNGLGTYRFPSEGTPCTNKCGRSTTSHLNWIRLYANDALVYEWNYGDPTTGKDIDILAQAKQSCALAYMCSEDCAAKDRQCSIKMKAQASDNGGSIAFNTDLKSENLQIAPIIITTTTTTLQSTQPTLPIPITTSTTLAPGQPNPVRTLDQKIMDFIYNLYHRIINIFRNT